MFLFGCTFNCPAVALVTMSTVWAKLQSSISYAIATSCTGVPPPRSTVPLQGLISSILTMLHSSFCILMTDVICDRMLWCTNYGIFLQFSLVPSTFLTGLTVWKKGFSGDSDHTSERVKSHSTYILFLTLQSTHFNKNEIPLQINKFLWTTKYSVKLKGKLKRLRKPLRAIARYLWLILFSWLDQTNVLNMRLFFNAVVASLVGFSLSADLYISIHLVI